jgi:hypothetical protein
MRLLNFGIMFLWLTFTGVYPLILCLHVWLTGVRFPVPSGAFSGLVQRIWVSHGLLIFAFLCQCDYGLGGPSPYFPIDGLLWPLGRPYHKVGSFSGQIWGFPETEIAAMATSLSWVLLIPVLYSQIEILRWRRSHRVNATSPEASAQA